MTEMNTMDVLLVGAGPASLAAAIRLKQLLNEQGRGESVVVIEKAEKVGQHNLSGAVFEADVLDELIPGWRESEDGFVTRMLSNGVERDETVFLAGEKLALKIPQSVLPGHMRHRGDYLLSVSEMVGWLAGIARGLGVEIYTGFAASEVVMEGDRVKGVRLRHSGLDSEGNEQSNFLAGETLEASVTVFGEGSLGQLAEQVVQGFNLGEGRNPQVHSVGVKEVIRLPENNNFGSNRVVHTVGFPNRMLTPDVFGGGALYSMGENMVAVALILALDWRYCDLSPQRELQLFKSHRTVAGLLEGGDVVGYGAKTIPEGGYYSLPKPIANGAVIVGDAAGFANVRKLKGLHYAIKSGIAAGEAVHRAIEEGDFSAKTLGIYEDLLRQSFVMRDLRRARNHRQMFARAGRAGMYLGAPLTLVQQWIPFKLGTKPDHERLSKARLSRTYSGGIDRLSAVNLSGTAHREGQPSHVTFTDTGQCVSCGRDYGCHPCEFFCPAEVYRFEGDRLILSPSNCVHCQTCRVKCPHQVIRWVVPEGGGGPRYRMM